MSDNVMTGPPEPTVEEARELEALYSELEGENMLPLWTQRDDLMPGSPTPNAIPYRWQWKRLLPMAERAGRLVPVGRGGERRAIALANPGLKGLPYTTPTLWCAIQYLGGHETAPEHRHTQNAFRFVVEGEGVWTVVNGDPVRMSRGDLLLTPGWNFHGHYNSTDKPMAWIDGLDIPLSSSLDTAFFEYGIDRVTDEATPEFSRSERLWSHPGLTPLSANRSMVNSPIGAYRWEHTDAALNEQFKLEDEGFPATVEQGHAAVRYSNPSNGGDVMPTVRAQFHRLRSGVQTRRRREVGSSVFQVFEGRGRFVLNEENFEVEKGDVVAVPSWVESRIEAEEPLDLFQFGDQPVMERLNFDRVYVEGESL